MSAMTRLPRQSVRWSPEDAQGGQGAQAASEARQAQPKQVVPKGRQLHLGTLAVIGLVSIGAVAGLAFLNGGLDVAPPTKIAAAPAPETRPRAMDFDELMPAVPKPIAAAPAAAALLEPRPVATEPIKTGSLSQAPRSATVAVAALAPEKPPAPVLEAPEPVAKAPDLLPAPAAPPSPPAPARPVVSAAEASAHLARAEAALSSGDLVVARSFFGRLAQAGDARGAIGMARTYDEAELRKLPVYGLTPDRAEAARWRARAREMESAVARN